VDQQSHSDFDETIMTPHDYKLHELGFKLKFAYSIVGLVLGLACILTGLALGLAGVTGHTAFTASLLGLSTNLTDAAPGVVVFVVGIFMVLITRFKVKAVEHTNYHQPEQLQQQQTPAAERTPGGAPEPSKELRDREMLPPASSSVPASSTTSITYTTNTRL
jgi:hypothetical protein